MKANLCTNLDRYELENISYIDYTNLSSFNKIPTKFFSELYWEELTIPTSSRFEVLSNIYYGVPDYWDIIMCYNGVLSLFDIPQDNDLVYILAEKNYQNWYSEFKHVKTYSELELKTIKDDFITKAFETNETYRVLKFIKPEYISELLKEIKL